jgi:phosphatidylserine/phosphatidylglycerophosphate/cardiolipin synthase-like enzyme
MATKKARPPREWRISDLQYLGEKDGVDYRKAIPVLILEEWLKGEKEEGVANYVWTNEVKERLEDSGLVTFKPRGTGSLLGSLPMMQKSRNLTRPILIEYEERGRYWLNLPHYEPLLQEYRRWYRENYQEDYMKLFPQGEPEWEPLSSQVQYGIPNLLAPIERALRHQQRAIERLAEEKQNLQAELEARTNEAPTVSFVHTSPDFHNSEYCGKVTSIKDTIADMLTRAEHAIRISTRQMDIFADELIALKRRSPDIEIIVLSRGPQGAEGDRKRLAGMAFRRMKEAHIKMLIEKDVLHSRLIVIDTKEVLASSADLDVTQMDLEFNAGIWTNNPDVVAEAIRYFDNVLRLSQEH